MIKKYPEYILCYLRMRHDMEENDTSRDEIFSKLPPSMVFSEVLKWNGLLGGWDDTIKCWILDIYGIDLDKSEG